MFSKQINKPNITEKPVFFDYIVCFALPVLSQFADRLQSLMGVNTSLIALIVILLSIALGIHQAGRVTRVPRIMMLTITLLSVVCFNSLINGADATNALKPLLLMIFVCLVGPLVTSVGIRLFMFTIVTISIVITIDGILNIGAYSAAGVNLYNIRQSTIVDKPIYTIMYALSITLIMVYYDKLINNVVKLLSIVIVIAFTYFGFLVIESKTFIFAVLLSAVALYVVNQRRGRTNVLIPLVVFALILLTTLFYYSFPEYIPDTVKSLISNLFGVEISYSTSYDGTFFGRNVIASTALSEFLQHPIVGIGFGNFSASFIWGGVEHSVNQTESSWLSFLTEGGMLYFLIQFIFNSVLIVLLYRRAVNTGDKSVIAILLVLLVFGALNIVNDFANNLYWCALAVAYGLAREAPGLNRNSGPLLAFRRHCGRYKKGGEYGSY